MTEALKAVAGAGMKSLLARLTRNRFTAALAGAIVTGVVQSSSVTTVLVVGFISAGLLKLSQSIGVIIGANIGTTITAQIIAFRVYKYGLVMIAVGFLTEVIARQERFKQWGTSVMGLGLIFFGMELMSNATGPLRTWPPFIDVMQNMRHPVLGIAIGAVVTAVLQSSSATTGMVIVLASAGLISLESGIGLLLGANIGTCVTAIMAAIGRPREATQAAWIHVVFNVGGVLLIMFFIGQFADVIRMVSPNSDDLEGQARLAADTPRQIANAHTLFNVGTAFLFIWFTGPLAQLVERIVPQAPEPEGMRPQFLDRYYLEQPALALDQVRRELTRLAEFDRDMLRQILSVVVDGSREKIQQLARADDDVDALHGAIVTYLGELSQQDLVEPLPKQLYEYISIANYLENIGDVIENNLLADADKRLKLGVAVSPSTLRGLRQIHDGVCGAFENVVEALRTGDQTAVRNAEQSKASINALAEETTAHLAKRLVASEPNRLAAFQVETDIIENLKRLNTLTRRIARILLEPDSLKSSNSSINTAGEKDNSYVP